jgi:hypothetical protein
MSDILDWVVWAGSALIVVSLIGFMRRNARLHIIQVFQVVLMLCCVIFFLFCSWSKFHLLWAMPACFLGGLLGFMLFRIPLVGTILRVITLAFAQVFFIGSTGSDLSGILTGRAPRPRSVPIISGLVKAAMAIALFVLWQPSSESSFWWWARDFLIAIALLMAFGDLKRGLFSSGSEIERMIAGDYNAKGQPEI